MRRRLQRVADTRARVEHPNVVRAHTVDLVEGQLRLVLDEHRAPTLAQRLARGPLDPPEAAHLVEGLARGYHSLARAGLTGHRFTPDGVLVDSTHGGILAGSGVPPELLRGKWLESDPDLAFRSPEELRRQPVHAGSAVYSLGALLYTALTGEPPYAGAASEVYASHFAGPRPRPTACRPELPRAIDAVLGRAMAVDPQDRYATPADLAAAASGALGATPSRERPTTVPAPRTPAREPAAARPAARAAAVPAKRPVAGKPNRPTGRALLSRRSRLGLLAAVAVMAFALLGVLLAQTTVDDAPRPPERISARGLSVRPPAGWARVPAARDEAFPLRPLLAARPSDRSDAGMGVATLPSRTDLEPLFAYAAGDFLAREAVRLGPLNAWRYTGLRMGADGAATAYVAPTTGGLLLVICHAGGASQQLLRECTRAAGTVRLERARPASLGSLDYGGERLGQVADTLAARRSRARDRLATAELARGQADAARALRWSYASAAAALERRSPLEPVGSFDALSASLSRTAAAYGSLARAAQRSQRSRYASAVGAVQREEQTLDRALAKARATRP